MFRTYFLLLLFICPLSNAVEEKKAAEKPTKESTETAPMEKPKPSREQQISAQIEKQIRSGEALKLGPDDSSFLALYKANIAKKEFGAVLLLHDLGANANWPQLIRPLRLGFAKKGWHTLSLQLPMVAGDADKKEFLAQVDEAVSRVSAGVALLQEKGQTNILLIGHGLGAAIGVIYLSQNPDTPIKGLAAISLPGRDSLKMPAKEKIETGSDPSSTVEPTGKTKEEKKSTTKPNTTKDPAAEPVIPPVKDKDLYAEMAKLKIPFLDIYAQHDYQDVVSDAEKREEIMQLSENPDYRQQQIEGADHYFRNTEEQLLRRLRGWLQKHVKGTN